MEKKISVACLEEEKKRGSESFGTVRPLHKHQRHNDKLGITVGFAPPEFFIWQITELPQQPTLTLTIIGL